MRTAALSFVCAVFALLAPCRAAASPLSPSEALKRFRLADSNLVIELVAAEPDVRAPVAIAWDADGRMFVAEMTDYPSGPVNGRIRLLEDRDADGRYDHATLFATNVAFPNSVLPWRNGLLVTAAPDLWFLADTNGDGRADVRQKILTGFAEGNQQLRVNGLFPGIDNWIYGANGRSDGEVKWADGTPAGSIRRRDFRFRPDTKQFEAIAGNSQFGTGHDDWGNRFPVFNAIPIRHVVMEDRCLERQPLLAGTDTVPAISPEDGARVFALTDPALLIPQPIGFFTSACGPGVYRGTALPESYRGNYFVCEPVQNLVQRRILKPNGSTFLAEYAHTNAEFLASTDPWFHGVFTATGPDGALYIVDMYREWVEHPQWVAPEVRDKVNWRRGEEHGRIWRIRQTKPAPIRKLARASNTELVIALESENGWTRDTAQRLLVERSARDAVPALERLARQGTTAQTRVHALHLLDALNPPSADLFLRALDDPSPRVREHAVRLLEAVAATQMKASSADAILRRLAAMTGDADARVRLQLAASLGGFADDTAALDALARLAQHESLDEWQATAILGSAGTRPWRLLGRLGKAMRQPGTPQLALFERAARMIASGTNSEDKRAVLEWLAGWNASERVAVAAAFAGGFRTRNDFEAADAGTGAVPLLRRAALEAARDVGASLRIRSASVRLISPSDSVKLIAPHEPEELQVAAARALMESNDAQSIRDVLARWADTPKAVRRQIVASAVRSRNAALELLHARERSGCR